MDSLVNHQPSDIYPASHHVNIPWPLVIYRVNSWMNLKKLSIGKAKLVLVSYTESIMKITTKYDSGPHKLYHAHESFPSSPQTPVQLELFTPTPKQAMIDRFSKRHDHPQNLTVFSRSSPRVRVKLLVLMALSAVTMIRSSKCGEAYLVSDWTACFLQERNGVG